MLSTWKLYFLLVLLPQALWLFSYDEKLSVNCEGCSFSRLFLRGANSKEEMQKFEGTNNCEYNYNKEDELTAALCQCHDGSEGNLSDISERKFLEDVHGGWHIPHCYTDLSGPCNIERRDTSLTVQRFLREFSSMPVILTGFSDQQAFKQHSTKYRLLRDYGHEHITVATANTHSYHKAQMSLCDYVVKFMKPQKLDALGNETYYHFGDNDRERWDSLFSLYRIPPLPLPGKEPVLSFGLAGPGSGVPFHMHGPTYAETIYGRKRWFLYPPEHSPTFDPDQTTLLWFRNVYPNLPTAEKPLECTLNPGEILFIPDRWWHSTLNVDSVVFMSVFYS